MLLTSAAIKRPLFMLMLIGAVLVMGLVGWSKLGVDLFPALDYPVVSISTVYPGAGPEAVDSLVTRKIEDAVAGMNSIDYVQSTSLEGLSSIVIVFTEKAGKDSAVDVERRVSAIRGQLPADIRTPSIGKFDPAAQPVLQLAVSGNRDLGQMQRIGEDKLQKRLEGTSGVGSVTLVGGLEREIQVQVDQQKLQARGLSVLQVNQALAGDNLNVPAGSITQSGKDWTVRLNNAAQTPQELNGILLASTANGPVYVRDVATVVDTYKKVSTIQRANGAESRGMQTALGVTIVKQASANTVEVADAVKKTLKSIEAELPADVSIKVISDASVFTRQSLDDVTSELQQAVILTGLVLLLFLHTFRSTVIVLLAIPTSLVATLAVMYFLGFSLNMMSTMGLTLTVGILVDDSIVVLENIFRHLQMGKDPRQAALDGRSEIGFAAIAITLVDVVVFAPIAFMSGVVGQYFREFGLVIATATLFSLFVSFTLTPLLASRWYRTGQSGELHEGGVAQRRSWNPMVHFARAWNRGYGALERVYATVLRRAIGRWTRWVVVSLGVLSFVGGIALVATGILSTEFLPDADNGQLNVTIEMPAGTALDVTNAAARKVEERVLAWPEVDKVFSSVGSGGGTIGASRARFATIFVELKSKRERVRTPADLASAARDFGRDIPGAIVKAAPISMFGASTGAIAVRIQGEDPVVLRSLAARVADIIRRTAGTADVNDGGVTGQPELVVSVDRERAADLGLSPSQVAGVLRTGLSGSTVGSFRPEGTRGWDINVILSPGDRASVEQVTDIPIVTPKGSTIKLGQVAGVTTVSGPTQVTRRDRARSVTVSATNVGRTTGDIAKDVQVALDQLTVPAGYRVTQGGAAQQQNESFLQIFQALGLSVLLMYMLMVALYESLLYPFIVLLSLPLAVVGAFGLLALTGNSLNMMSMIGMILLTGLVGKNAILLVDFTNTLRKQGVPRDAALTRAGPTRLRPILMTTSAMVLAMLPLALRLGEGSEWRAPMAVTVIGGLLTSTLLTLVLIPAVYTILDDFQGLVSRAPSWIARTARRKPFSARQKPRRVPEAREAVPPMGQSERPRQGRQVPVPVGGGSE